MEFAFNKPAFDWGNEKTRRASSSLPVFPERLLVLAWYNRTKYVSSTLFGRKAESALLDHMFDWGSELASFLICV